LPKTHSRSNFYSSSLEEEKKKLEEERLKLEERRKRREERSQQLADIVQVRRILELFLIHQRVHPLLPKTRNQQKKMSQIPRPLRPQQKRPKKRKKLLNPQKKVLPLEMTRLTFLKRLQNLKTPQKILRKILKTKHPVWIRKLPQLRTKETQLQKWILKRMIGI
jgi:hypothetical protein